jgi:hypothetical protein
MITRSGSPMLAADQIGDGGLIVGAVEVGLCEGDTVPAIAVHDNVIIFRRSRNNRGPFTHTQLPRGTPRPTQEGRVCMEGLL